MTSARRTSCHELEKSDVDTDVAEPTLSQSLSSVANPTREERSSAKQEATLRDSSDECLIRLYKCFNKDKLFLFHPTGSGKTRKAATFFCHALLSGRIDRVLCLITRDNLEKSVRQEFSYILKPVALEHKVTIMKNYNVAKLLAAKNGRISQWENAGIFFDEMHNLIPRTLVNRPTASSLCDHRRPKTAAKRKKKHHNKRASHRKEGTSAVRINGRGLCKSDRLKIFQNFIKNKLCVLASATPLFTDAIRELRAIAIFTGHTQVSDSNELVKYFAERTSFPSPDLYKRYPCSMTFATRASIDYKEKFVDVVLNDIDVDLEFPFYRVLSDENKIDVALHKILHIARTSKKQFILVFYLMHFDALRDKLTEMGVAHETVSTTSSSADVHRAIQHFNWGSCKILLTTTIFSEGHGLRNVDIVHLVDPCHQYGSTSTIQALGRSARLGSHTKETVVTVYMYATTDDDRQQAEANPDLFNVASINEELKYTSHSSLRRPTASRVRSRHIGFQHRKYDLQKILYAEIKENTIRQTLRKIIKKQEAFLSVCPYYEQVEAEVKDFQSNIMKNTDDWTWLDLFTDIILGHNRHGLGSELSDGDKSLRSRRIRYYRPDDCAKTIVKNVSRAIINTNETDLHSFLDACVCSSSSSSSIDIAHNHLCTIVNNCVLRTGNEIYDLSHIQISECLLDRKNVQCIFRNLHITLTRLYNFLLNWYEKESSDCVKKLLDSYVLRNLFNPLNTEGLCLLYETENKMPCYYRVRYIYSRHQLTGSPRDILRQIFTLHNSKKSKLTEGSMIGHAIQTSEEAVSICSELHGNLPPIANDRNCFCKPQSSVHYSYLSGISKLYHRYVSNENALHEATEAVVRSMIQKYKRYESLPTCSETLPSILTDQKHDAYRQFRENILMTLRRLCDPHGAGLLFVSQSDSVLLEHRMRVFGFEYDPAVFEIDYNERNSVNTMQSIGSILQDLLKITRDFAHPMPTMIINIADTPRLVKLCNEMHTPNYTKDCVCSTSEGTPPVDLYLLFRRTAVECKRWVYV